MEDRRSLAPAATIFISITGVALLLLFNYLSGGNLSDVLNQLPATSVQQQNTDTTKQYEGADSYEVFASKVLGSDSEMWKSRLNAEGKTYIPPKLVLFRQATESGCGVATSQVGPHYCSLDHPSNEFRGLIKDTQPVSSQRVIRFSSHFS